MSIYVYIYRSAKVTVSAKVTISTPLKQVNDASPDRVDRKPSFKD